MIFDELVQEVCERLNLTSDEAKSRVAREVNARYRRLTSSIGLETSRRSQVSKVVSIGNRVVTFTGVEKLFTVIEKSTGKDVILEQITTDEMHAILSASDPPSRFAITAVGATTVTVTLDATPATGYTLYADALVALTQLSGNQEPAIPQSFHDIIIFGAMADEYRKMEKMPLAQASEADYEKRLSDLRMFIAKTAWLDQYQGRYTTRFGTFSTAAPNFWNN